VLSVRPTLVSKSAAAVLNLFDDERSSGNLSPCHFDDRSLFVIFLLQLLGGGTGPVAEEQAEKGPKRDGA